MLFTSSNRLRTSRRFVFSNLSGDGSLPLERRELTVAVITGTSPISLYTRSRSLAGSNHDDPNPNIANAPAVVDDNTAAANGQGAFESSQASKGDSYGNSYQASANVTNNVYDPAHSPPNTQNGGQTIQIYVVHQYSESTTDQQNSTIDEQLTDDTYASSGYNTNGTLRPLTYLISDSAGGSVAGRTVTVTFSASYARTASGNAACSTPAIVNFHLESTFADFGFDGITYTATDHQTGSTTNQSSDPSTFQFQSKFIIPTGTVSLPVSIQYESHLASGINQTYDTGPDVGQWSESFQGHFSWTYSASLS